MDDTVSKLESEFCPPLDPAVFYAIVSDYDLSDTDAVSALRRTLETLRESAAEEGNTGFDPSGTSAQGLRDFAFADTESGYTPETGTITSEDTDSTDLSTQIRSLGLHSDSSGSGGDFENHEEYKYRLDRLDNTTKVDFLRAVFPGASEYSVTHTLRNCNGDVESASEELMNHVFFDEGHSEHGEERILARGVDAFSEDNMGRRGRQKQGKKKARISRDIVEERRASSLPSAHTPLRENAWAKPATGDTTPASQPLGGIEIIPQYTPLNLPSNRNAADGASWTQVRPRSKPTTRSTSPSRTASKASSSDPAALALLYSQFQRNAVSQAAAARQRGKSDHLMAAAAGHYSQVSREFALKSKAARREAASAFVASQSSHNEIDLHYVNVEDARRIAKAKTEEWWGAQGRKVKGLDGRWMDESGGSGSALRIVTGMGIHSEGGRARIKPAVEAMLTRDGWDFDSKGGVISVIGRRRN